MICGILSDDKFFADLRNESNVHLMKEYSRKDYI